MEESLNRHFKMVFEDFDWSTTDTTLGLSLRFGVFLNEATTWREKERL